MTEGPRGAKAVSGYTTEDGRLVVVRDDASEATVSEVIVCTGTLVDNGDSTYDITFP